MKHIIVRTLATSVSLIVSATFATAQPNSLASMGVPSNAQIANPQGPVSTDPGMSESFATLFDANGAFVGSIAPDGSTYDTRGNLVARIDADGNVIGADGVMLFDASGVMIAMAGTDGTKASLFNGTKPQIRLNRAETKRIAEWTSPSLYAVASTCRAWSDLISNDWAAQSFYRNCASHSPWEFKAAALNAASQNRCLQISVPNAVLTTWAC